MKYNLNKIILILLIILAGTLAFAFTALSQIKVDSWLGKSGANGIGANYGDTTSLIINKTVLTSLPDSSLLVNGKPLFTNSDLPVAGNGISITNGVISSTPLIDDSNFDQPQKVLSSERIGKIETVMYADKDLYNVVDIQATTNGYGYVAGEIVNINGVDVELLDGDFTSFWTTESPPTNYRISHMAYNPNTGISIMIVNYPDFLFIVYNENTGLLATKQSPSNFYSSAIARNPNTGIWWIIRECDDTIDVYNENTGIWTTETTVTDNGRYGMDCNPNTGIWMLPSYDSNVIDVYNENTGLWTTMTSPSDGYRNGIACNPNTGIWKVIVGIMGTNDNIIDVYNENTGIWTTETTVTDDPVNNIICNPQKNIWKFTRSNDNAIIDVYIENFIESYAYLTPLYPEGSYATNPATDESPATGGSGSGLSARIGTSWALGKELSESTFKLVGVNNPVATKSYVDVKSDSLSLDYVKYEYTNTQIINSNVALGYGKLLLGTKADGTQHTLVETANYSGVEQVEVGNENTHLNLNTDKAGTFGNHVTVDTPDGKRTVAYTVDVDTALITSKNYTDEKANAALQDAKDYTDDTMVAAQVWLPAVSEVAGLPVVTDMSKTYLCRVVNDNDVYQCIAGQSNWLLYSTNTDYVDELELAASVADWNVTDNTSMAYIKNKPAIPAAQVNSDWSATTGVAQILNKPTIPIGSGYIALTEPAKIETGYVRAYLSADRENLIIDESPNMQVSRIDRNDNNGAMSWIEFNGSIYSIPAGSSNGYITKSIDGISWENASLSPGDNDNRWAFQAGSAVVLLSSQVSSSVWSTSDFNTWTANATPAPFTTPVTAAMQTKTGRIITTNSDGTETFYTDDGGATWVAGTPLPAVTTNGGGSYAFATALANNQTYPDRIVFVNLKSNSTGAGSGNCIVAYSDDNGASWTLGPNAPTSFKTGVCTFAKSCGYLISSVSGNGAAHVSRDGGMTWASLGGPGGSNALSSMMWVDDGSLHGVTLWKMNNAASTRMRTNLDTGGWSNGPNVPATTAFPGGGTDNRQVYFNGSTIKFMSNAITYLFNTERIVPLITQPELPPIGNVGDVLTVGNSGLEYQVPSSNAFLPNYSNMETVNRITANNGTWIADRNGFVKLRGAGDTTADLGWVNTAFYVNSKSVGTSTAVNYPNAPYVNFGSVFPVSKGDVVKITVTNNAGNASNVITECYFIPPKAIAPPYLDDTYSTTEVNTGNTWIDGRTIYKRVIAVTNTSAFTEAYKTVCAAPSGATKIINATYIGNDGYTLDGSWRISSGNVQLYCRTFAGQSPSTSDYVVMNYLK